MIGEHKKYEKHLGLYGDPAEIAVACWLDRIGYSVKTKGDKYAPDISCQMDGWNFTVEVERCQERRWASGAEPIRFDTISVIERRLKYFKTGVNIVVSSDMTAGYVILRSVARKAFDANGLERYFKEMRLMVPVDQCLLVDLTGSDFVDIGMRKEELFGNEQ